MVNETFMLMYVLAIYFPFIKLIGATETLTTLFPLYKRLVGVSETLAITISFIQKTSWCA